MAKQLEFGWDEHNPEAVRSVPERQKVASLRQKGPAEKGASSMRDERAVALQDYLTRSTALDITLKVNANRSRVLAIRYDRAGKRAFLNAHRVFLDAPPEVLKALAQWTLQPKHKSSGRVIDAYIAEQSAEINAKLPRRPTLRTQGLVYDLLELRDEVNAESFDRQLDVPITWGKLPPNGPRRSIRFGSYACQQHLVRIHPYLDHQNVPRFVVKFIVFHEMLHAALGIDEMPDGRRAIHPPRFRELEKLHPDYDRATAWIEDPANLRRLLRTRWTDSRRSG